MRREGAIALIGLASALLSVLLAVAVNVATGGSLPAPVDTFAWLSWPEVSGNVVGGSGGEGGGILQESGTLVLRDSSVDRNSANGSGTSQAGGILNSGGAVTFDHSEVSNNASTTAPGGVWTNPQFTTVNRSEIRNNIPTNCDGSPVIVTGCAG
ncbi:hypothetical protein MBT84_23365 [Streptomyces sp. MBT84]|uniref:hypothetical protein n=1 Tax=unclassified Streptomyces TaxID=2593676 RepID=UPI001C6F0857|nr:hypothetical protein [Streptomyces sp. MBT84]MBW8702540.1 hypothetical protein [Streptomyces sp. MBT84]